MKRLQQGHRLEEGNRKNLSQRVARGVQIEALLDDGDEDIDRHGDPDLRLHRIPGIAGELLDPKMLLDSLEKQFHLPAALVERADGGCWQHDAVGEERQGLAGLGILVSDTAQMVGVVRAAGGAGERDGLIADDARTATDLSRIDSPKPVVRLGACDEEGVCLMQHGQPSEVQIVSIHDVDRPGLQQQDVEHIDVAQLAVGEVDEAGNFAAQVQQRMHLHCGLGGAKQRPRKERQTQVDGGRIQCLRRVLQRKANAVARIERACSIRRWANSAWIRQSGASLASASVERLISCRTPMW